MIDDDLRDAYLARLGLEREPPSAGALFRLHRAHVERVPYETLWIQVGERWTVDPERSAQRIAREHRGGYCFHLNGAFSELLASLGYDVVRHVGGVHGPAGPSEDEMANHLVLTVSGLPAPDHPDGTWYVDAGLGDALHEPLPLVAAEYTQRPFTLALEATTGGVGDWHLAHDPAGAFTGMAWRSAATTMAAFEARHVELSSAPDSGFVKYLSVFRRDGSGVDILRGKTLFRYGSNPSKRTLANPAELGDALGDVFGLRLSSITEAAGVAALWERVETAHAQWLATSQ